jgi:hypothetical protein
MGDRDAPYMLVGILELDDFFIGAPTENGKRVRGTDKNQVLIAVSKNKKGHPLHVLAPEPTLICVLVNSVRIGFKLVGKQQADVCR